MYRSEHQISEPQLSIRSGSFVPDKLASVILKHLTSFGGWHSTHYFLLHKPVIGNLPPSGPTGLSHWQYALSHSLVPHLGVPGGSEWPVRVGWMGFGQQCFPASSWTCWAERGIDAQDRKARSSGLSWKDSKLCPPIPAVSPNYIIKPQTQPTKIKQNALCSI